MIINSEDYLRHYGILRKSGRYPFGSGNEMVTLSGGLLSATKQLRAKGLTDTEIAKGLGFTTTQLRAGLSIEGTRIKEEKMATVVKLRAKGMGPSAIGKQTGQSESSVRSLLAASEKDKSDNIQSIAGVIKKNVDEKGFIDVGAGVDSRLGITESKLKNAVALLQEDGYVKHNVQVPQATGNANQLTTTKILTRPGTTYLEAKSNLSNIRQIGEYSTDNGRSFAIPKRPLSIDADRVAVRYSEKNSKGEEIGGGMADGVIYVRRGVPDVTLGGSTYAQVRIAVGGTHYLKGMAVYKDDMPKGVDLEFNTNKSNTGNKLDAMKKMEKGLDGKIDKDTPFTSQIRRQILDDKGTKAISVMNILEEEGTWGEWSKTISTQVLSKQSPLLAKQQLDMTFQRKREQLDEIMALTNPTVRKKLLEAYASGADSSAVHLKAAHLPRQATHVILPLKSLKPTEVYAPNYNNGDVLALVRYPHGGKFEIPELRVNNGNREGKTTIGIRAPDAIGIHPKVAAKLSGADFDGDTVVVIPNNNRQIKSEPSLKALQGFDPQQAYKGYDGMKTIDGGRLNTKTKTVEFEPGKSTNGRAKGTQMGRVSNLITDMTILGANNDELARAVKHSMVVIDAEKHSLDYKRSYTENGIQALNKRYQNKAGGGSSTLISRATSPITVDQTSPRRAKDGGPIDRKTGAIMTVPKVFVNRFGETVSKTVKVDKLANTKDAFTLVSPGKTAIESVYATHSNRLKGLANEARKEVAVFKPPLQNKSAKVAYKPEVDSLLSALRKARMNKPLERQAQIFANAAVNAKLEANPHLDPADIKKLRTRELATARARVGANKNKISPSSKEWAAIQAGAISYNQLNQILDNADLDSIKALATPRTPLTITPVKAARAQTMASAGYTQSEIASALGISTTTLGTILK